MIRELINKYICKCLSKYNLYHQEQINCNLKYKLTDLHIEYLKLRNKITELERSKRKWMNKALRNKNGN